MLAPLMRHLQKYVFRGLLAIIPIGLCVVVVWLLYVFIDKKIVVFLNEYFRVGHVPGVGIVLLLVALYLVGLLTGIIGRRFLKFLDAVSRRIPVIKTIYSVGVQLAQGISTWEASKDARRKLVLVKIREGELWVLAFLVNSFKDPRTGEERFIVYMGAAPAPTQGLVLVVKPSEIIDPGWSPEESLKVLISAGIVVPKEIKGS